MVCILFTIGVFHSLSVGVFCKNEDLNIKRKLLFRKEEQLFKKYNNSKAFYSTGILSIRF